MTMTTPRPVPVQERTGDVSCYICTRIVKASVLVSGKQKPRVRPGQKCPRCGSAIDSAAVLRVDSAQHPIGPGGLN